MKRKIFLAIILGIVLTGCGKKAETADGANAGETAAADNSAVTEVHLQGETDPGELTAASGQVEVQEIQIGGDIAAAASTDEGNTTEGDPQAQADAYISDYIAKEQSLAFANLTGRDLKEIYVSFSEGDLQNIELLQGSVLRDGAGVNFHIEQLSQLRGVEHLKLSVTAVASDDTRMEFPAIAIWDISATNIVLTKEDDQYTMYLE